MHAERRENEETHDKEGGEGRGGKGLEIAMTGFRQAEKK